MSAYELYLFVHIVAAIVWIGGAIMFQILAMRIRAADDAVRMAALAKDIEWVGLRIITPTAFVLLVFGFLLVWEGPWSLGDTWIWLGLVGFGITFLAGFLFFGPESGRIGKLIDVEGGDSPAVQARISRILNLARLDTLLLVLIVLDMAVKPGS